jgi:hypothetical protein
MNESSAGYWIACTTPGSEGTPIAVQLLAFPSPIIRLQNEATVVLVLSVVLRERSVLY